MAQPEFHRPECFDGSTTDEIHERMMASLPDDIDDMPAGFPYDFTRPAAEEKSEFINYHLIRAVMLAFPQYAWDDWLDLHGAQVHVTRHEEQHATGNITITGAAGSIIAAGTVFCVPAIDDNPAIEFATNEECTIAGDGTVTVSVTAVESGTGSNVAAHTVCIMAKSDKNITGIDNAEPISGGTAREEDGDYYDRIFAEYDNSKTYLGNDSDFIRWAKEAGAGDCIVVAAFDGPGTVKLVLVDGNGQPANTKLINDVYNYIVSPSDRTQRLLPTACAKLSCVAATTVKMNYTITGLLLDESADKLRVEEDFKKLVLTVYGVAKNEGMLRYNDVRPLITSIEGVEDFDTFLINGKMSNIKLEKEEYPVTGTVDFRS